MSLISNFLKKIFGKNDTQTKTPTNNYIPPSTEERDEKINNAQAELKSWLITYLNEHKELDFSWESGNDEAFVSFDGKSYVNHGIFDTLEYHIIDKLNIPDAGEFQMNGNGIIYMTEKSINAKYRRHS